MVPQATARATAGLELNVEDVRAAQQALVGVSIRTPLISHDGLDRRAGVRLLLKAEHLQHGGSFKLRGARYKMQCVAAAGVRRVVAVSSGNHGIAVAAAAHALGLEATVLVPHDTPAVKMQRIRESGASVIDFDRQGTDRDALVKEAAARLDAEVVHPYDDPVIMAGQGTVALEVIEQIPDLDTLVVPMSGGGLMAGCAVVVRALAPRVRIIGVEPTAADDTRRSMLAGERVRIDAPATVADSLAVTIPGERTFAINQRLVDEVVTVSDQELCDTMRVLADVAGIGAEPGGAAAAAAVLAGRVGAGGTVVAVLSGGNVDGDRFLELTGCELP